MTFSTFNLSPRIAAGVAALGYQEPTPIQEQAIPSIMEGRDLMGLAQTGTGKTAAFALPILQRLEQGPRGRVRALVVAPTRELAEQIHQSFNDLGRETRLRSIAVYGGVGIGSQLQGLRTGPEIVVACPGRLLDHIRQGTINLTGVEVLVIDEADRMFDMGFLPDVRRIVRAVPAKRQTLLFSATMPNDIRELSAEVLHDPITVQIGHSAPVETVSHALYPVPPHLKTMLLIELLRVTPTGAVLIFTRTKHRAKRLAQQLQKAGFRATSLQGNLSQNQRDAALGGFRRGKYDIMVATDIAARGIDVSSISHVINYDMPDTTDAYTHRIGRTGRAEHTGEAFTLITGEDAGAVRAVEHVLGSKLERRTLPDFNYRASTETLDQSATAFVDDNDDRDERPARPVRRYENRGPRPQGNTGRRFDERRNDARPNDDRRTDAPRWNDAPATEGTRGPEAPYRNTETRGPSDERRGPRPAGAPDRRFDHYRAPDRQHRGPRVNSANGANDGNAAAR
jgi:ATP-dependent RNA helicase RhlE